MALYPKKCNDCKNIFTNKTAFTKHIKNKICMKSHIVSNIREKKIINKKVLSEDDGYITYEITSVISIKKNELDNSKKIMPKNKLDQNKELKRNSSKVSRKREIKEEEISTDEEREELHSDVSDDSSTCVSELQTKVNNDKVYGIQVEDSTPRKSSYTQKGSIENKKLQTRKRVLKNEISHSDTSIKDIENNTNLFLDEDEIYCKKRKHESIEDNTNETSKNRGTSSCVENADSSNKYSGSENLTYPRTCKSCNKIFDDPFEWHIHEQESFCGDDKLKEARKKFQNVLNSCSTCKDHECICFPEYPKKCNTCLRSYQNSRSYRHHLQYCVLKEEDGFSRSCDNCSILITNQSVYNKHVKKCKRKEIVNDILKDMDHSYSSLPFSYVKLNGKSRVTPNKDNFTLCPNCNTLYLSRASYGSHYKNQTCDKNSKRVHCIYPDCKIKFTRYEHLLMHLPHYHNDHTYQAKCKVFSNFDTFQHWKTQQQNEHFIYLVKTRGAKKYKNTEYQYFECQYNAVSDGKRGSERKTSRRRKNGIVPHIFCPARMTVAKDITDGKVVVNYIETHSHDVSFLDAKFQRFPKSVIKHITSELLKGVSPTEIFQYYQKDIPTVMPVDQIKMSHLITLKFIRSLKSRLFRIHDKSSPNNMNAAFDMYEDPIEDNIQVFEEDSINNLENYRVISVNEFEKSENCVEQQTSNNNTNVFHVENQKQEAVLYTLDDENETVLCHPGNNINFQIIQMGDIEATPKLEDEYEPMLGLEEYEDGIEEYVEVSLPSAALQQFDEENQGLTQRDEYEELTFDEESMVESLDQNIVLMKTCVSSNDDNIFSSILNS